MRQRAALTSLLLSCLLAILMIVPGMTGAGEVAIPILPGWNMVSLPVQPADPAIAPVLAGSSASLTSVWKWENGVWAVCLPGMPDKGTAYASGKGFVPLTDLNSGEGFWLNASSAGQLVAKGQSPGSTVLSIGSGWSLAGLKSGAALTVDQLFSGVKQKITSVWVWKDSAWAVALPGNPDDGVAYAQGKGFSHLTEIQPGVGFWVNASEAVTVPLAEGKVMAQSGGTLTPVAKATVFLNNNAIAITNDNGLFQYQTSNPLIVTVKAEGFSDQTGQLTTDGVRSYFLLDPLTAGEPEATFAPATFQELPPGITKTANFTEYPNLFLFEATIAESAKATPKELSDGIAALTITDMALAKDTTAAVSNFSTIEAIVEPNNLDSMIQGAQTSLIVGGANVLLSDALGNPTTSQASGFSGKVRPMLKNVNLNSATMGLAAMKDALAEGTGKITLFICQDKAWQAVGDGVIIENGGAYTVRSAPGVMMDGLYPFLFIFGGQKVIHGSVASGGQPVAQALISVHGSDGTAVTLADGSFAISVPDLLPEAALTVCHEKYKLAKPPTVNLLGVTNSVTIDPVTIAPLAQSAVQGTVTDHHGQAASGVSVSLRFPQIPPDIAFPAVITAESGADGSCQFPVVPDVLLADAVVEVAAANGYHAVLDESLPAPVNGTSLFNASLVIPSWVYSASGNLYAAPALADGTLYLGGVDGWMRAVAAATGEELWKTDVGKPIFATPALDNEHLYFGTAGNQLVALQRSLAAKGAHAGFSPLSVNPFGVGNLDIVSSPVLTNGVLSFGGNDDGLYYFGTDGAVISSDYLNNNITGSAALADNTLYFGGWDGRFQAYPASGSSLQLQKKWQFPAAGDPLPARILSSPLAVGGKIYFGGGNNLTVTVNDLQGQKTSHFFSTDGSHQTVTFSEAVASYSVTVDSEDKTLYSLNAADGSLSWTLPLDGAVVGRPSISGQTMFVATLAGTVWAIDLASAPAEGCVLWKFSAGGPVYSTPVPANGRLYFGGMDNRLYCLDAVSGSKQWTMNTGGPIIAPPVVAGDKVYAASLDGVLYGIQE